MENIKGNLVDTFNAKQNGHNSGIFSTISHIGSATNSGFLDCLNNNSIVNFPTGYDMEHQQVAWMPTLPAHLNIEPTMNHQLTSATEINRWQHKIFTPFATNQSGMKKPKAKSMKTIRQISASELETLEHSYRNDSNYKSAANCKKLALEFGLKYTQIRRWFMKRKEKDEQSRSSKSEFTEIPATETPVFFTIGEKQCGEAAESVQTVFENRVHLSRTQSERVITEEVTRFPVLTGERLDQRCLIQQWRNNPHLRPPVNELYLTDLSDDVLFNY